MNKPQALLFFVFIFLVDLGQNCAEAKSPMPLEGEIRASILADQRMPLPPLLSDNTTAINHGDPNMWDGSDLEAFGANDNEKDPTKQFDFPPSPSPLPFHTDSQITNSQTNQPYPGDLNTGNSNAALLNSQTQNTKLESPPLNDTQKSNK